MDIIGICRILVTAFIFSNSQGPYELFSMGCQMDISHLPMHITEWTALMKELIS